MYTQYSEGEKVEKRVAKRAIEHGASVKFPTDKENMEDHFNIIIDGLKYGVKGMKKENRKDISTNENIHWIEFKNVQGKLGWLYGKAYAFIFETQDDYLFVKKERLQGFVHNLCKDKIKCNRPEDAYGKLYTRSGRKDIITKVKTYELEKISYMKWKK